MKNETIQIDNLKCGGCAATIKKNLLALSGVREVEVILENGAVDIAFDGASDRQDFVVKLGKLGYPEKGTGNTFQKKVKSYVSCAVGRLES
ncbi:MAG: heavy-metal-associated domain-containing protein [Cyclobacteriaceae bacterium]